MENMTLLIDPETRDLVLDEEGHFTKIFDRDTTVQNVRHALLTWKAEFFADSVHGTDYERILGVNQNDVDDLTQYRQNFFQIFIFQEPDVSRIDSMTVSYDGRSVSVAFTATLVTKETITLEVTA